MTLLHVLKSTKLKSACMTVMHERHIVRTWPDVLAMKWLEHDPPYLALIMLISCINAPSQSP